MTDSWVTVNFLKHYHLEIKSNDENEEHGCMCFLYVVPIPTINKF